MNVLDLFSGIGGFSLGLERAGMRTVAFCEIEPFCRGILKKHWARVPIHDDVRTLTSALLLGATGIAPDVICGGFPCQDISIASGGGDGLEGERSGLWREYARLIGEFRPDYVERQNLGYYAGYCSDETRRRVERLFRCSHPIFGAIGAVGAPTIDEAIQAGKDLAQRGAQ